jgi:DNA processing protein
MLVETIEHILEALRGWQQMPLSTEAPSVTHPLLMLLHAAPHTSEALAITSGWALPKVLAALTELEMDGRAVCESGRWFARVS